NKQCNACFLNNSGLIIFQKPLATKLGEGGITSGSILRECLAAKWHSLLRNIYGSIRVKMPVLLSQPLLNEFNKLQMQQKIQTSRKHSDSGVSLANIDAYFSVIIQ
ncbi:MAG: hypothetical protein KKD31_02800, partial [Bacteroidetes bacterium]|nr:hypothetical protein [Bacteroidota bacterium]